MKIGNSSEVTKVEIPRQTDANTGAVAKSAVSQDQPVGKIQQTDKVELSNASQQTRHEAMPVRSDKVAQIRAAIERGEFPVDPKSVAERMISQAIELVNLISPAVELAESGKAAAQDAAGPVGRTDGRDA